MSREGTPIPMLICAAAGAAVQNINTSPMRHQLRMRRRLLSVLDTVTDPARRTLQHPGHALADAWDLHAGRQMFQALRSADPTRRRDLPSLDELRMIPSGFFVCSELVTLVGHDLRCGESQTPESRKVVANVRLSSCVGLGAFDDRGLACTFATRGPRFAARTRWRIGPPGAAPGWWTALSLLEAAAGAVAPHD